MKDIFKPITMICKMDTEGKIIPGKLFIEDEESAIQKINVMMVRSYERNRHAGNEVIIFKCQIKVQDTLKECEIGYELLSCKWTLRKMS